MASTGNSDCPEVTGIVIKFKKSNFLGLHIRYLRNLKLSTLFPISSRMLSDRYLFLRKSNLSELNQTNRTQSNSSISSIGLKICESSIAFDYRTLSNPIAWFISIVSMINRTFNLVRLVTSTVGHVNRNKTRPRREKTLCDLDKSTN